MSVAIPTDALALRGKLFRGLSDPSRLAILEALRAGRRSVGEIVEETGLSQPNVSNHLSCLRECGLVISTQEGRYVRYQLSDPRVAALIALADELVAEIAQGIYDCTRYAKSMPAEGEL